jgi:hypothetical protein
MSSQSPAPPPADFSTEEDDSSVYYVERERLKVAKNAAIQKAAEVLVDAKAESVRSISRHPPR